MEERIENLSEMLIQLLQSKPLNFDEELHRLLPIQHGIYRIYKSSSEGDQTLRAGRTKSADHGLRQRVYHNHFMGTQNGNIRSQLVQYNLATNLDMAKDFLRRNCKVQVSVIEHEEERKWAEYFMLSILRPKFCD